jgi:hypothetical protein
MEREIYSGYALFQAALAIETKIFQPVTVLAAPPLASLFLLFC